MKLPVNEIICGSALEVLKTFPDDSLSCSISSPPYWALRDYGVNGQLGLEKTFEEYIDILCTIYDEVKRVLRYDGTCFVNLGDTYSATRWSNRPSTTGISREYSDIVVEKQISLSDKSLCLIPQRFAIEMVNRGWILRNVIIWAKPNPMPSSAKDRFTVDFEYVYFFVKSKKYYFEPQYEPYVPDSDMAYRKTLRMGKQYKVKTPCEKNTPLTSPSYNTPAEINPLGRNKRCVWTIPTQPYPEAHFATFPEKLVEPMIKAGCPEFVCTKCGKPREKIYESKGYHFPDKDKQDIQIQHGVSIGKYKSGADYAKFREENPVEYKGYTDCGCGVEFEPGIVLDPFAGSCTTLQVAARLNRNYLGIELKPEYIEMGRKRIMQGETGIPPKEQNQGQYALWLNSGNR